MDIRSFLGLLESNEQLLRIKKQVSPEFELTAITKRVQETTNNAVVFENVKGFQGAVATNLLGCYKRV